MTWLAFVLAFQLGYLPGAAFISYDPPSVANGSGQFYQEAEVKIVMWKVLELGGTITVYDWVKLKSPMFLPNQLDSTFFADVVFGPFKIGWVHECDHPIVPYQPLYGMKPSWDGWRDEVYARLELEWNDK